MPRYLILSTLVPAFIGLAPAAVAQTCNAYFTASTSMASAVGSAFDAITARDGKAQAAALPAIEKILATLPATEIKAETCDGTHINAYTIQQYAELTTMRDHNVANGFSTTLPIVKQPELNHAIIAYAVGWIKFEQGDFNGALAAYNKGIAMFPHQADLQTEVLATLLQLKRYKDAVDATETYLDGSTTLTDDQRAKIWLARGSAQYSLGDLKESADSVTTSLNYHATDDAKNLQKMVQDALKKQDDATKKG